MKLPNARGRASRSNRSGRFEVLDYEAFDDGWDLEEVLAPARTEVSMELPRSVITKNTSPDLSFDRSINPYRGCEHGCIYCFARPTHAYLGLSPGLDFETKLIARPEAPKILQKELASKRYVPRPIALGTNTDPYQPIERRYSIMRGILEVLHAHNHPVTVVTKGTLIERDLDILGEMGRSGLASVGISVTSMDAKVSRAMEPRVPSPTRRLQTIRALTDAGCPVRVMVAPVVPGLTDHELESILTLAAEAGAKAASWIMLRLPLEVAPLFEEWLYANFPLRAERVLKLVREVRGGKVNDAAFGQRMTGQGVYAELIRDRFEKQRSRLRLDGSTSKLRTDLFQVPPKVGDQLSLF
ncbi:MAG: PA0069 family radical SAM protein [Boseongicola sp.]|nr:MAG: PA0069 family radical SAM protein [Boseongicola sp.]